jgi:hypothetical protein
MARPPAVLIAIVLTAAVAGAAAVKWAHFTNPSIGTEYPMGVCSGGQYIYVVGHDYQPGYSQWRIEMYSKDDGKVVKVWPKPTEGGLTDCIVVGNRLYVVGYDWGWVVRQGQVVYQILGKRWAVLSLDLNLNLVKEVVEMEVRGVAESVASDGEYLYIAGWEEVEYGDWQWRVEKRRLGDLSLVAVYTSNPTARFDWVKGVGINPATGHLWVVGDQGGVNATWRIEILDRDLNRLMVLEPGIEGWAWGVVFDGEGNAYVYGNDGVVKYNKDGKELARATGFYAVGAAYVGERLYVVTSDYRLFVLDANLNKIDEVDLRPEISKHVNVGGFDSIIDAVFNGRVIYVAGGAMPKGASDRGWLVFAVQLAASVSLVVVDGFGAVRDWGVEVLDTGGRVVASGVGKVNPTLLIGESYIVKIQGPFTYTTQITAREGGVRIQVPTGRLSAVVADGFGRMRSDWLVEIAGVASGAGKIGPLDVLAGRYVVRAEAFGREFAKEVVVEVGRTVDATVQIPTAMLTAEVVDGFGKSRGDWVVEIVNVTSGRGRVGPVEVLAGRYTARVVVFGKEFSQVAEVKPGAEEIIRIQIPTAAIDVSVVDNNGNSVKPDAVFLKGPVEARLDKLSGVEVLAGRYVLEVAAGGRIIRKEA